MKKLKTFPKTFSKTFSRGAFSLIELAIVGLIISVLMAGVMGSSALKKRALLANARTMTNNSPVTSIGDLILWYETTSEKSFSVDETVDGSTISTWYDINPNIETVRNNATQTTAGNRPTYKTDKINGLPAISFTRANSNYLSFDGSGIVNSNYTIFVVEQRTSNDSINYFLGGSELTANTNLFLGYRNNTTLTSAMRYNGLNVTYSEYKTPTPLIHSYTFNFYTKTYKINGTLQTTSSTGTSYDIKQPLSSYAGSSIGRQLSTNYYQGDIGEIIIFKKIITEKEIKLVEKYLGKKWGITISQ